jgi:hypothetical protein
MNVQEFTDALSAESAYELATYADCQSPDTLDSPGARYLAAVRDAVVRAISDGEIMREGTGAMIAAATDRGEVISRIADEAHLIYTYNKWQAFTDLCAYQRADDVAEDMGTPGGMDQWADLCLYSIAEDLCNTVCRELDEQCGEDSDGDDGDDASE